MIKYSDLETGEKNKTVYIKKQEYCWTFMLLCPIASAICVCYILVLYITNQFKKRDAVDDKIIMISEPWITNNTDIVKCSIDNPCEMTCYKYEIESGNKLQDCEFSYIWIIVSISILIICSGTLLCSFCNLFIGYICYPKEKIKKVVVASA